MKWNGLRGSNRHRRITTLLAGLVPVQIVFLSSLLAFGPVLAQGQGDREGKSSAPNIVLILSDATRADHLSCYGYPKPTTPHLADLAREGTLFENCISAGSWTLPSLASIFTGLYPREHGVNSRRFKLEPSHRTLAEVLRELGYATAGFSCNSWTGSFSGLDRGFEEFNEVWRGLESSRSDDGAAAMNEWVISWLDEHRKMSRPFFLCVFYFEPHFPYRPPAPYDRRFLPSDVDEKSLARVRRWEHPREVGYILRAPGMEISDEELRIIESQYDGEIAYLDEKIGELVSALKRFGVYDDTVVVVTSDHGEHLGDHGLLDHKMSLYDPLLRVPLIVRYPPEVPAGLRIEAQVQTTGLFPALLSLGKVEGGAKFLMPSRVLPFRNREDSGRTYAFSEFGEPDLFLDVMTKAFPGADVTPFSRALKAVRTRQSKLIWASDGRHELYDLVADPGETVNLFESQPGLARDLISVLEAFNRGELP